MNLFSYSDFHSHCLAGLVVDSVLEITNCFPYPAQEDDDGSELASICIARSEARSATLFQPCFSYRCACCCCILEHPSYNTIADNVHTSPTCSSNSPLRYLAHVAHALAAGKFQIDMLRCLREVNVDHQQVRCLDSLCSSTQASCEVVLLASCSVSCLFSWH